MASSYPLFSLDDCDQTVRIGKLVSASPGTASRSKPVSHESAKGEISVPASTLNWKPRVTIAGCVLIGVCSLMVLMAWRTSRVRPSQQTEVDSQPSVVTPVQTNKAVTKRAAVTRSTPILLPMPREAPETLAILPREATPEVEVVLIEPREVTPEPPVTEEFLTSLPRVVEDPTPIIVEQQPMPVQAIVPPAKAECGKFATKIDFLLSPTAACDKAKSNTNKLVMVLQIAGNFEEPGFT